MELYYTGLNCSSLFTKDNESPVIIEKLQKIQFDGLVTFEIGWNFSLLCTNSNLYISGKLSKDKSEDSIEMLKIPNCSERFKNVTIGMDNVFVVLDNNDVWLYNVYEKEWKRIPNFIHNDENIEEETIAQMLTTRCTLVLTNLGRVFSIPTLIDIPKRLKFIKIAGGFDHTIMLTENGSVYSMGMGTRGQLGHFDLEDCDNPKQIEALAGLKVTQISAGGWHNAIVTDQGDLYTWGWNTNGELGLVNEDIKACVATPHVVDFKHENGENIDVNVMKVECGNNFTICMTDDDEFWGCGSNKYGQLGKTIEDFKSSMIFVKLNFGLKKSVDFKCREWGTCIVTEST